MASCSSCNSEVPAGNRWCGICHTNAIDASIGRLASPVRRLAAHVLDLAVPVFALFLMLGVASAGVSSGNDAGGGVSVLLALALLVGYVIWAFRLFSSGTTPGKSLLGMRVVKENGTSAGFGTMLCREWIGKAISGMLFSLGFLWILFDRDNQGWHDKLVSTYVVG